MNNFVVCADCEGTGDVAALISMTNDSCDVETCKTCKGTGEIYGSIIDDELAVTPSILPVDVIDLIRENFTDKQKQIIGRIGLDAMNAEGFFVGSRGNNFLQAEEWRSLFRGLANG